jgi:hypothetical protein
MTSSNCKSTQRRGEKIIASTKQDENSSWRSFPEQTVKLPDKIKVGIAALNITNQPFVAEFEDLKVETDAR